MRNVFFANFFVIANLQLFLYFAKNVIPRIKNFLETIVGTIEYIFIRENVKRHFRVHPIL
jgi:hypothetical protein